MTYYAVGPMYCLHVGDAGGFDGLMLGAFAAAVLFASLSLAWQWPIEPAAACAPPTAACATVAPAPSRTKI